MAKVKLTVISSNCRCGYHRQGDEFIVEDLCPPMCHELWNAMYPAVFTLINGGMLDCGNERAASFTVKCPDEDRVTVRGEVLPEQE